MSKELVISSNAHETKVAILEDDQLVEIYFQRANEYSLAGSIHKGRVTRVLPGMQSAFVDLGLERDTFLYVSDFFEENGDEYDRITDDRPQRGERRQQKSERPERAERTERAEAPAAALPAVTTPPAPPPPPVEIVEPASAEEPPAEAAAERGEDGDRGDRRGRRSRRRRSRGRGFPDSKYASDVAPERAEPEPQEIAQEVSGPAAEVFLLPGETLRKYASRPSSAESEISSDDLAAEIAEDRFDIGLSAEEADEVEAESLDGAIAEEEASEADTEPLLQADEELDDDPAARLYAETLSEPDPSPEFLSDAAEDTDVTEEPVEDLIPSLALEPDLTDTVEAAVEAAEADLEDEIEPEPSSDGYIAEDDDSILLEGGTEVLEVEPASEAETPEAAAASVRDQSNRYQHRLSRRMRRNKRGGERTDRPERPEKPQEIQAPVEADPRGAGRERPPLPSISDLLREGQEIIVQIAKEPLGQKGARITSHIALPGRFVVFMPTLEHLGVSRKIASDEERQRLKRILQASRTGITGGFIVRTAGEGRSEEEIAGDMAYLYNLWLDIRQKAEKRKAPVLLHHDLDIVQRILRDQLSDMFKSIWIDNEDVYESVLRFMQRFQPSLVGRVKMYTRPGVIFDTFGVTQEIEKALRPKVWLKSGGYIVINQTEALVAIDVNTGKFVGKSNRLEDTITKTNTEAVKEIVRQVRLRDLGGIIVVDFIDMDERKNRQKVMQALEEAMRADRAPYKILQFNDFGLVAITRKRVKQSLERALCAPCPVCEGAGYTKSINTVMGEILQEAVKLRDVVEGKNVVLRVYPDVAKFLKSNTNDYLEELEGILRRPVMVMSDPMLHPEKFDLAW